MSVTGFIYPPQWPVDAGESDPPPRYVFIYSPSQLWTAEQVAAARDVCVAQLEATHGERLDYVPEAQANYYLPRGQVYLVRLPVGLPRMGWLLSP